MPSNLHEAIEQAIIEGIRRNGERVFNLSQTTEKCFVPRDTGFLAMSGSPENITNGVEIRYRANYSQIVHDGRESSIPITGTQRIWRATYRRKDGTAVQGHWVEYANKKLIGFRPKIAGTKFERGEKIWRVISEEKPRKGNFFLSRAFVEEFPKIIQDIDFYIKRLEGRQF